MAFSAVNFLTMISGIRQIHYYQSTDAIATISASGYFNSITSRLKSGDVIFVGSGASGVAAFDQLLVSSATYAATVTTVAAT